MRRVLYSAIAMAGLLCASANAEPPQLKGRYAYTGWATCQFDSNGFTATQPPTPLTPADFATHTRLFPVPPTSSTSFSMFNGQGIISFYGNGNGHHEGTSVTVYPAGSVANTSFDFTYTIDANGLLRTQLSPGTFTATELNLDGSIAGSSWTTDKVNLVGFIANNASVITLATELPEVETQTYQTGPQTGQTSPRICSRTRTLTWLGEAR